MAQEESYGIQSELNFIKGIGLFRVKMRKREWLESKVKLLPKYIATLELRDPERTTFDIKTAKLFAEKELKKVEELLNEGNPT